MAWRFFYKLQTRFQDNVADSLTLGWRDSLLDSMMSRAGSHLGLAHSALFEPSPLLELGLVQASPTIRVGPCLGQAHHFSYKVSLHVFGLSFMVDLSAIIIFFYIVWEVNLLGKTCQNYHI